MLTSAKLSVGYLVVGITRELDKKPSLHYYCYELRSLGLDNRTTLVLSNTRELDRVPKIK